MTTDPVILALDCSAAACSVALWRGGSVAARRFEAMSRGQAEALMPMVERVMQAGATRYAELDLVAATVGPGSFTGLRIGLAAARGLALAAGVPVIGLTSFAAIAEALPADAGPCGIAIDDRRGGIYWQEFAADRTPVGAPAAIAAAELAGLGRALAGRRLLVAGDGVPVLRRLVGDAPGLSFGDEAPPDAAAVARLAARLAADLRAGKPAGLPPVPLYLRPPEAKLPEAEANPGRPGGAAAGG